VVRAAYGRALTQNQILGYGPPVTEPTNPEDATPPSPVAPADPDPGRLIDRRYRLVEIIGSGGMATVHRAVDTRLDRTVAVKLLRREVLADSDIAMRFRREALAATVLRHPNIVACLETGTDNGQPYLVMELIEGEDLAARLRRGGRLEPAEAARIGLDVARALGVAHVRGIVHRDVKPGNILLARDGRAMVTDFGIARLAADAEGAVPGTTLGSVHYFSPEQATGATTTAASDVYSLGLVLFESLTGQRAWGGDTTAQLVAARIDAAAPSPRAIRPEVPAALDAVVVRALDPDPAGRYQNGGAMAAALESVVASPDPSSPTVAIATVARPAAAATPVAPPLRPEPTIPAPPRSVLGRRTPRAIVGPLAVLLIVASVVVGALLVAALPGGIGGIAVATASPHPSRTPTATARPTPTAQPTPTARQTPAPTPTAAVTPLPAGAAADLCEPFLGFACGLGAGAYEPSAFRPAIRFVLGDGWSTAVSEPDIIALERAEGELTIAAHLSAVFSSGRPSKAPANARAIVEAFIDTAGVAAGKPSERRIDKRKATVVDLSPTGSARVAIFSTADQTFYLEPHGTTRVIVVDGKDGPLVIAIEPVEGSTLKAVLPAAGSVIDSLRFR
jgi:eukaryotic-like serine/threonine-protein kinase